MKKKLRLGVLTSHPIQYQAPVFRLLAREADLKVFFAHRATPADQAKAGFGVPFDWDTDLLSGYPSTFLKNVSKRPGPDRFEGCDTPEISTHVRSERFDAFLVTGWYLKSYWQAVRACEKVRVPVMVRGDSQLVGPRNFAVRLAQRCLYPFFLRRFDAFLAVGVRSAEYFRHYGVAGKKIFFSPHSVDNDWFRKTAASGTGREASRRRLGIDPSSVVAIFVGKLIPKKRPADVLSALSSLKRKGVLVEALFVGSGQLEPALKAQATRTGVSAHFAGFRNQSELPALYAAADLLVLPSDGRETWGLVVNEAMACGLPCVVSDEVGCGPDLVEAGKTGQTYPVGDIPAFARAIKLVVDAGGGAVWRDAIRQKIDRYSVEETVRGILKAAAAIAGGDAA